MARSSKSAAEYQAKRNFHHTPEPAFDDPAGASGEAPPAAEGSFVIHRHEARRVHYDLRLAAGGVLVSWGRPARFLL